MSGNQYRGKLVLEFDGSEAYGVPWPIKVYEIGLPDKVGVLYPDTAWQIQPRVWWHARLRKARPIEEGAAPRRRLVRPKEALPEAPAAKAEPFAAPRRVALRKPPPQPQESPSPHLRGFARLVASGQRLPLIRPAEKVVDELKEEKRRSLIRPKPKRILVRKR